MSFYQRIEHDEIEKHFNISCFKWGSLNIKVMTEERQSDHLNDHSFRLEFKCADCGNAFEIKSQLYGKFAGRKNKEFRKPYFTIQENWSGEFRIEE